MFLDYYRMREQPFGVTPDPRFLFLGESHREALASLFYGIEADRGFTALIAPPGLGKTTLTFQLLEKLQQTARTVFLFHTQCNRRELLHYILNDLGVEASNLNMASMHSKLNEILLRERLAGRRFVLAIDEAQNLDSSVLETIRLLSNFETSRDKLLQILLIGQPQLADKLAAPSLMQLKQRIVLFARLQPFNPEDTARYIDHRLKVAGYDGNPLFTPGALRIIAERSQGIPRNINSLCFGALSLGFAMNRERIDDEVMLEVVTDLELELLNEPALTRRATRASVPSHVHPVLSYREKSRSRMQRWVLAVTGVAACMAGAGVLLSHSHGRIARFLEARIKASATVYSSPVSAVTSSETTSSSSPISSLNVDPYAIPIAMPVQADQPEDEGDTITVLVQSGETLHMIARQNLGQDSREIIEKIQELNPTVTDPNHIEVGQEIRLPQLSKPAISSTASGSNVMFEKTEQERLPNE